MVRAKCKDLTRKEKGRGKDWSNNNHGKDTSDGKGRSDSTKILNGRFGEVREIGASSDRLPRQSAQPGSVGRRQHVKRFME